MIMLWLWSKCSSIILVILIKMSPLTNLVLSSPRLTSSSLRPKLKNGSVHLYCTAIYSIYLWPSARIAPCWNSSCFSLRLLVRSLTALSNSCSESE